jgi:hypothetical protein
MESALVGAKENAGWLTGFEFRTFELAGRISKSFVAETLAPPGFDRSCPASGCAFIAGLGVAGSGIAGSGVAASGRFGAGVDSPNNSNARNDAWARDAPAPAAEGTTPVAVGETGELGVRLAAALLADLIELRFGFDNLRVRPEVTLPPGAVVKVDVSSRLGTSFISSGVSSNSALDCTVTLSITD